MVSGGDAKSVDAVRGQETATKRGEDALLDRMCGEGKVCSWAACSKGGVWAGPWLIGSCNNGAAFEPGAAAVGWGIKKGGRC